MLDNIIVGNQIAFLRKQNNFTQEEMAEKLGITAQAISKWENGHTLPETILLPLLAKFFDCSIDSILMPFAAQDSYFQDFVHANCINHSELMAQLYQRLRDKFDFTMTYDEKYNIFQSVYNGRSAKFNLPEKEDFIIRIDVEAGTTTNENNPVGRIPLVNCSGYMQLVDKMPEHIKRKFRVSDCKSCTCSCPYCMVYSFEGAEYKQCHFITIPLNSSENIEHALALVFAEHEEFVSNKKRSK